MPVSNLIPMPERQQPISTDLKLSLIAASLADLLTEAAQLQGAPAPFDARSMGEVLVKMQAPKATEKAGLAAEMVGRQMVAGAIQQVLHEWNDHSEHWFLQDRLEEVERKLAGVGEAVLLTYWTRLREPLRYCRCGVGFATGIEAQRGICQACFIRGQVAR